MSKILKKFLFILVICFSIMMLPVNVRGLEYNDEYNIGGYLENNSNSAIDYSSYPYYIDSYDVTIVVNENNVLDITEKITVIFNEYRHGIYRSIPFKNEVKRLDGTKEKNKVQISDIEVSEKYTRSSSNGNLVLKLGDPNEVIKGRKEYTIKYKYNLGKDRTKKYDELYFNLVGQGWEDTIMNNVFFHITMPKDFDESKLGFSSGLAQSTDSTNVTYTVEDNVINGMYLGVLKEREALTIRCELPEGYFVDAGYVVKKSDKIFYILPAVLLVISIIIWFIYGKDELIETVEFYPPEGFNSLDLAFLYKGKVESEDVVSLLIYLANKGYIKISENSDKSLSKDIKGFKITKVKDYDGDDINEREFLEGLFKYKKQSDTKEDSELVEVTSSDLYDRFYKTLNKIIKNINTKENKEKIIEKKSTSKKKYLIIMAMVSYCLITAIPLVTYGYEEVLVAALVFPGIGFTVAFIMCFCEKNSTTSTKTFGLVWGLFFGGIPWLAIVLPCLLMDSLYLAGYMLGLACVFIIIKLWSCMDKRTPYGKEILGRIKGFKNFLETAEKDKLESMVLENPTYFYDILPYTYVLGVSDKWIKKFEVISLQAPDWYEGSSSFDSSSFGTFMNSTMTSASSAMSSSPSSSSGGSSGGGSSGGGSGGGGGGSW